MSKNRKNSSKTKRSNKRVVRRKDSRVLNVRSKRGKKRKAASGGLPLWLSRTLKISAAALFVFAIVFGVRRAIDHVLYESPKFKLAEIDYQTDGYVPKQRVLDIAKIDLGMNILRIDLEQTREELLRELPQVRKLEMVRDLPARLALRIEERHPIAWLGNPAKKSEPQKRRGGLLLDEEGVPMRCEELEDRFVDLPVVFSKSFKTAKPGRALDSKQVTAALGLVSEFADSFATSPVVLENLQVANAYSLLGTLNTGSEITFGLKDLPRQIKDLHVLLAEATRRGRPLMTANLLVKKNIPVRFGTGRSITAGLVPRALPVSEETPGVVASPPPRPATLTKRPKVRRSLPQSLAGSQDAVDSPRVRSILRVE